ncbi:MAG: hydantoinase/oxoprolinase family protein, partial [Alphaproteobacteria bacterium]|nr:hydantoinase/oxoprolinase family protein [Alphaproteobacteria bacterium]
GTYTDAALIDQARHKILSSAKSLTTKGDLALGVSAAMRAALAEAAQAIDAKLIKLVSVSTTLATNAVVEGHGSAVAVILVGFDDGMVEKTGIAKAFAGMPIVRAAGGHDHNGDERAKLDIPALEAAILAVTKDVTAFAVASTFAVRNPSHENKIREIIQRLTEKPTTLSSEIATALDAPRRALTAVLNARLISRITQLVKAVRRSMTELGIDCPLMIVKGDGSLANADLVAERPIETVLSGPAASVIGAKWLSGLEDFIMSDMGGTTTDIGVLEKGQPRVAESGAEVGGWRTMVRAIDVKTIGLGGDSEVHLGLNGDITVGPQRAVPISLIGQRYPEVITMLEGQLAETDGGSLNGRFVLLPFGAQNAAEIAGLSPREAEMFAQITERPQSCRKLAASSAGQRAVAVLRKKGLVQYAAFTPSDAAHVLNMQDNWSRDAAVLAGRLLCRFRDMKHPDDDRLAEFCRAIWHRTVADTARVILQASFDQPITPTRLLDAVCEGKEQLGLVKVSLSPQVPIVAVGGPVQVYYPEVGRRLGTEIVFTPHCDVANAVGAAAGLVAHRAVVNIEGDGNGVFRITGAGLGEMVTSGATAIALATARAEAAALGLATAAGAQDPKVVVSISRHFMPEARNDDGLLTAVVSAEAVGRPHQ